MAYDPWTKLDEILIELREKGEIILAGDFNARTGTHADYISMTLNMPNIIYRLTYGLPELQK